jgi:hypothetical protein
MLLTGLSACAAAAGEPIAAPRPEPEPSPPPYLVAPPIHRIDRYAVWQNYAVDRQGYFRPRVIDAPFGAYYYLDGKPYPWLYVHTLNIMPYASD